MRRRTWIAAVAAPALAAAMAITGIALAGSAEAATTRNMLVAVPHEDQPGEHPTMVTNQRRPGGGARPALAWGGVQPVTPSIATRYPERYPALVGWYESVIGHVV